VNFDLGIHGGIALFARFCLNFKLDFTKKKTRLSTFCFVFYAKKNWTKKTRSLARTRFFAKSLRLFAASLDVCGNREEFWSGVAVGALNRVFEIIRVRVNLCADLGGIDCHDCVKFSLGEVKT